MAKTTISTRESVGGAATKMMVMSVGGMVDSTRIPRSLHKMALIACCAVLLLSDSAMARPMVRNIKSTQEFDRLLEKHASETGLPVIVDFYSDGCGPCRQIAPVYQKMAKETGQENAVFVKVDTNAQHELSSRYNIRSLPTFFIFYNGKKVDSMSGAGAQQLQQMVSTVVSKSRRENVLLSREALMEYYSDVDGDKDTKAVDTVYNKCADMNKKYNKDKLCFGSAALQLTKGLNGKYSKKPTTRTRFTPADRRGPDATTTAEETDATTNTKSSSDKPNLHKASKEELMAELEKRIEAEEDAKAEEEEDDDAEFAHSWIPSSFPERVTIIGGGPAGMSAAIYAARAGLKPVVIAPPMGGQLQGKGVDVENYPGLHDVTGPAVVNAMRIQAVEFGAVFEAETVLKIDATSRPLKVYTNSSVIETHAIVLATGAESNWLNIPGEYDMRGGGVSSCATCDGAIYRGKDVMVVGGGDTAMEEALVLARTSNSVTVIHRKDTFRASKILAQRVIEHPSINIVWNTVVQRIIGEILVSDGTDIDDDEESENVDLDSEQKYVTGAILTDVETGEESKIKAAAVFVAIGHTPTTSFVEGIVEFDEEHPGYVKTPLERSTQTTVAGIFAAGDVSDPVYRQAVTSAGSGAAAALDAERWLSEEGLGNEEAEFEAELMAELMADDDISANSYNSYEEMGGRMTGMKESARVEL